MIDASRIPAPVYTQEVSDCAICATQYVCRWFGHESDRNEIKRLSGWTAARGATPSAEYMRKFGLETRMWCCETLVREDDPDRPGVKVAPPSKNWDQLYAGVVEHLAQVKIGATSITRPEWEHAVVVVGANPEKGTLTVVCSLRGVYEATKEEFFTGATGKLTAGYFLWVWRPED